LTIKQEIKKSGRTKKIENKAINPQLVSLGWNKQILKQIKDKIQQHAADKNYENIQ
jgi:hypothetical protein